MKTRFGREMAQGIARARREYPKHPRPANGAPVKVGDWSPAESPCCECPDGVVYRIESARQVVVTCGACGWRFTADVD